MTRTLSRRRLLLATAGTGMGLAAGSLFAASAGLVPKAEETPADAPPHSGDLLTFADGARQRNVIKLADLEEDSRPVLAWPMDSVTGTIKNANLHNLIVLLRAEAPGWFSQASRQYVAAGVAAYSAICTHLCCTVSSWSTTAPSGFGHALLLCPCHKSEFDPWNGAKVVSGPAPRPLPALPLELGADGKLRATGGFVTRVGCIA